MSVEKEFVPYELAVKLKELGFNEPCLGIYLMKEFRYSSPPMSIKDITDGIDVLAPTFSQAMRFFREKYGLYSWVKLHNGYVNDSFYEKLPITWTIMEHESGKQHYEKDTDNYLYHTHEEAELACLLALIEIIEKQNLQG